MAVILFYGAEPFEVIIILYPFDRRPHVKYGQAISKKKTFKDYAILYMYIAQGQGQITPGDKSLIVSCLLLWL